MNVGNWLKNNLGWDQAKIESHTQSNTDATFTLQQALKDMESQGESQTTRNAIQGADLSLQTPEATINAINQHQKYMALYKSQKATAMGNYLTARTNEAYAGKPYKGMYDFEDDFAKDFPVQVFVAAGGATSGQPFSVWSKGLTDQQKGQVMQLVLNTEGPGTQISMPAEKADEKGNRPDTMRPITPGKIGTLPPTNPDFRAQ